jgi:beta-glucanase (GH16 family)
MTSWNKFCFTGGILEASVSLPGANNVLGLWPAVWSMGNLGECSCQTLLFYLIVYLSIPRESRIWRES